MRILITNDDGWGTKGIWALVEEMRGLGDVTVVAPDGPRSGQSSAITVLQPLRLKQIIGEEGFAVYLTNGTPTDCIKLGITNCSGVLSLTLSSRASTMATTAW